jgi:HK97 family phage prohead protease
VLGGLAIPYNRKSHPMSGPRGAFLETVAPGFADLAKASGFRGVISRYAHDDRYVLGNVDNQTLTVTEDARGAHYTVEVPEYHDWIYQSAKRGDLRSSSWGFANADDDWSFEDGMPLRTLRSADIHEVGPTPIGAYPDATTQALRSLAAFADAPYDDVKQRADNNDLAVFFMRSDKTGRSGADALAQTMVARTTSGRAALVALDEMRQPQGYLSGPRAKVVLTEMLNPL